MYDYALMSNEVNSTYNNEKARKNYDGTVRACKCGVAYYFDVWDSFRSISDRNISTKIVDKDFNITVASLDESGVNLHEFNGTVCVKIDNNIKKLIFNDTNISSITFNIKRAIKQTRVKISWKKNIDTNCPLSSEDNSTLSSDDFAIRPDRFTIFAKPPFYAGDRFSITFKALSSSDKNSTDYNETKDISFMVESNITKIGCYDGSLNMDNFSFKNGIAKDINASYSNIGDINITIKEKLGNEFAKVDSDDTSKNDRLIKESSTLITLKPYDINVTDVTYTNSSGKSWLYDADVGEMNTTIKTTIKAFAKGATMPLVDFNKSCYAKDINLSFLYDVNYSGSNIVLDAISLDGNITYYDINYSSIFVPSSIFVSGEANVSYAFNVKRAYNRPLNPLYMKLKDINITTLNVSKNQNSAFETNNIKDDQNSTFYYARLYVQDFETTQKDSSSSFFIDVYCNGCQDTINSYFQDSFHWYRNEFDLAVTKKTDIAILPKEGFKLSSLSKSNIAISNITDANKAEISFDINNSKDKYDSSIFHLLIPKWLWFNEYRDYNSSNSSDCSTHPCIEYRLLLNAKNGIKSGTFSGSDIGHEQNTTIKKIGIKVYR